MRNFFKKFGLFFLLLLSFALLACKDSTTTVEVVVESIAVETELTARMTIAEFDFNDIMILVTNSDGSIVSLPLTGAMLSSSDLAKLSTVGTHTITVIYQGHSTSFVITLVEDDLALQLWPIYELGFSTGAISSTYDEWIQSIRGSDGAAGREITLRVAEGQIQWQYVNATTWTNLISVASLIGQNGKEVTFQIASGYLQWQYSGDATWQNLLLLSSLSGADGVTPTISISIDGFWVINGIKSEFRAVPETPVIQKVTLTFDSTGGFLSEATMLNYQNLNKGDIVILPVPTKAGSLFAGWFTGTTANDGQFTNTSILVCDLLLVAHWLPDYAQLRTLLDTLASGSNFTVQNTVSYIRVTGEKRVEDALFHFSTDSEGHKISSFLLDFYAYLNQDLVSEELAAIQSFSIQIDGSEYYYWLEPDGSTFGSRLIPDGDRRRKILVPTLDSPFEYLIPEHFTKRENANIFDYLVVDQNLIDFANVVYNGIGIIDILGLSATFYGDTNELILSIPVFESEEDFELIYTVEISYLVSAVGSTTAEFPLEAVRSHVSKLISDYALEQIALIVPTDASLLAFNPVVIGLIDTVTNATGVVELYAAQNDAINQISSFPLITDPVKVAKNSAKNSLLITLNGLVPSATDASITQMTLDYDDALLAVNAATTTDAVTIALNSGTASILSAYLEDAVKVELIQAKIDYKQYLFSLLGALNMIVINEADQLAIINQYTITEPLITNATTLAQVKSLVETAIGNIRTANYPMDSLKSAQLLTNAKANIRNRYLLLAQEILEVSGIKSTALDAFYADIALELESSDLYNVLLIQALALNELESIAGSILVPCYSALAEEVIDLYSLVLSETELLTLQGLKMIYLDEINLSGSALNFFSVLYNFKFSADMLLTTSLQTSKLSMIKALMEHVEAYAETATAASHAALELAYDNALIEVLACTSEAEVDANFFEWLNDLQNAYDYDPIKLTIQTLREDTSLAIDLFEDGYDYALGSLSADLGIMNDILQVRYAIADCTEASQVTLVINQLKSRLGTLLSLVAPTATSEMQSVLDSRHDALEVAVGTLPQSFEDAYDSKISNLLTLSAIEPLISEFVAVYQWLDAYEHEYQHTKATNYLTERLNATFPIIIDSEQFALLSLYNASIAILDSTHDGEVEALVQYRFGIYCSTRTIDSLKNARFSALGYALDQMEVKYTYITDDSITAMQARYGILFSAIQAETNFVTINNLVTEFLDDLVYLYEEDAVKGELEYYRHLYELNLMMFGDMAYALLLDGESAEAYTLENLLGEVSRSILSATTLETLHTEFATSMADAIAQFLLCEIEHGFAAQSYFRHLAEMDFFNYAVMTEAYAQDTLITILSYKNTLLSQISATLDPIEMYQDYLFFKQASEGALFQARIDAMLLAITDDQNNLLMRLPALETSNLIAAIDVIEAAFGSIFLTYSFDYVVSQYEQVIVDFVLLTDPLKNAKRYAIEAVQALLVEYYLTSTAESLTAQYNAMNAGYDAIYAATLIADVETVLADTLAEIELAYVEDAVKSALQTAILTSITELRNDVQLVLDLSGDYANINKWLLLQDEYEVSILAATSQENLTAILVAMQLEIDAITTAFDEGAVEDYRIQLIAEMTELMDSMEGILSPDDFSSISTFRVTCVDVMNMTMEPFEIRGFYCNYVAFVDSLA